MAIRNLSGRTTGGRGALSRAEEEKLKQGRGGDIFSPASTEDITEPGVFDTEDTDIGKEPQTIDVEPGKMAEPEEPLKSAMLQGGGNLSGLTPDRQPVNTAQPAPAEPQDADEPSGPQDEQGMFDDLEDINERQKQEREAFADELESRRAEAEMAAQARAGLGGMGLSGATTALVGDVGRQEARAGDIAMADLARQQSQERFQEVQREQAIWDVEQSQDKDLDGDGTVAGEPVGGSIGDGNSGNDPLPGGAITPDQQAVIEGLSSSDLSVVDKYDTPGQKGYPYVIDYRAGDGRKLAEAGIELTPVGMVKDWFGNDIQGSTLYKDQYGNYYAVGVDPTS